MEKKSGKDGRDVRPLHRSLTTEVEKRGNGLHGSDLDTGQSKEGSPGLSGSSGQSCHQRSPCLLRLGLPLSPCCVQSLTRSSQWEVCIKASTDLGFRSQHLQPWSQACSCRSAWHMLRTTNISLNTGLYCPLV